MLGLAHGAGPVRVEVRVGVAAGQAHLVGQVLGRAHAANRLKKLAHKLVVQAQVSFSPKAPAVRKTGLVEHAQPSLVLLHKLLLGAGGRGTL